MMERHIEFSLRQEIMCKKFIIRHLSMTVYRFF